ncbi:MAG: HAMP domain-containing sensor histidine kinase [Bacteroidales bacterium]
MENLNTYIKKGSLLIFNVTVIVGVIGYVIDIINFNKISNVIIYNNAILILITISAFVLFHLKKLNLKTSFAIVVYAAFASVLFYNIISISLELENNIFFFLRDSVFIILVLTLAALISSKYHALIIAAIFIVFTVIFNLAIKNDFLQSSLVLFVLYVSAYSIIIYFFVDILEKSITDRKKKEKMISNQNTSLNEVNVLLEERQQKIEEQAEELKSSNDLLKTTNEKLNELNAMKDRFFSIIGHDLKNPVSMIMGFSELLKSRIDNLSVEKRDLYIDNILNSSKKTYSLLENLLDWARSQSGRMTINPQNINLVQLISSNILLLKELIRKKKISVITEFPEKPAIALSDSNMIDTVIRNLLNNAIKFTHSGGKIFVKVDPDEKAGRVKTVFSDTGVGIPADKTDKLFSLDRKYSTEGTAGETGTGLGLILCKEFVEKNNGEIWAESESGKGSTFTFVLPMIKE